MPNQIDHKEKAIKDIYRAAPPLWDWRRGDPPRMTLKRNVTRKQFYFANQSGSVIHDVISVDVAPLVMAELKRQGFYYCYSMPVS